MIPEDFKPHIYPSIVRYQIIEIINNLINNKSTNINDSYIKLDSFYDKIRTDLCMICMNDLDKNQILNYLQDWKSTETNKGGQISSAFSCWRSTGFSIFLEIPMRGIFGISTIKRPGKVKQRVNLAPFS